MDVPRHPPSGSMVAAVLLALLLAVPAMGTDWSFLAQIGHGELLDVYGDDVYVYVSFADGSIRVFSKVDLSDVRTVHAHTGPVQVLFQDGSNLYSASNDTVKVWNKGNWFLLSATIDNHTAPVSCIFADDKYLYTGLEDGNVFVWDKMAQFSFVTLLPLHASTVRAITADGSYLYTASMDRSLKLLRISEGFEIASTIREASSFLDMMVDDDYLYTTNMDNIIRVRNKHTTFTVEYELEGHKSGTFALAMDHRYIYSASDDGTVQMWYRTEGLPNVRPLKGAQSFNAVYVDDVRIYATGSDRNLWMWNKTGDFEVLPHLELGTGTHTAPITALFADDTHLYSGSKDMTMKVWEKGAVFTDVAFIEGVSEVTTILAHGPDLFTGWDNGTIAISPTTGDVNGTVWRAPSTDAVLALFADDERMFAGFEGGDLTVCPRQEGTSECLSLHLADTPVVSLTGDVGNVYAGMGDGVVRVVLKPIMGASSIGGDISTMPTGTTDITALFADDAHLYAGSDTGELTVWTWGQEDETRSLMLVAGTPVLALFADASYLYLGSGDGRVRVLSKEDDLELVHEIEAHVGPVHAIFADGDNLYSGAEDGTIRVWLKPTGVPSAFMHGNMPSPTPTVTVPPTATTGPGPTTTLVPTQVASPSAMSTPATPTPDVSLTAAPTETATTPSPASSGSPYPSLPTIHYPAEPPTEDIAKSRIRDAHTMIEDAASSGQDTSEAEMYLDASKRAIIAQQYDLSIKLSWAAAHSSGFGGLEKVTPKPPGWWPPSKKTSMVLGAVTVIIVFLLLSRVGFSSGEYEEYEEEDYEDEYIDE